MPALSNVFDFSCLRSFAGRPFFTRSAATALYSRLGAISICAMAALLALPACTSEQAEGKRCDLRNGNLDCEAPLLCRSATELSLTDKSEGVALCCPAPGQSVTVNACRSSNAILPPDPLDDAGTSSTPSNSADASTSDAGTGNSVPPDASTGSGSTASVDAGPVDAGSAAVDAAAAAASDASATSTVDSGA